MEGEDCMAAARMLGVKVATTRFAIVPNNNGQPIEDQRQEVVMLTNEIVAQNCGDS